MATRQRASGRLRPVLTILESVALGGVVGLGVAVPLGAIGVLLLQTGMTRGWRPAAAGGIGAALVDLGYATAAVLAGTAVAGALTGREPIVHGVGAAVLGAVALTGLVRTWRGRADPTAGVPGAPGPAGPGSTLLRFVGLTALNPLTVVYFAAVAAGLADRLGTAPARVAFVLGIGAASAAWQLALAAAGTLLGARVTPGVRAALGAVGYGVVGAFAFALLLRSLG